MHRARKNPRLRGFLLESFERVLLLQQLQNGLRLCVGLGEHGSGRLYKNLVLDKADHLLGHIGISNGRF